jgi:hypothetical protein
MNARDFIEKFYSQSFDEYRKLLIESLAKNNYKLYRYIPIHKFIISVNKEKKNLLHRKQFGFNSITNQYIYHNKPSCFNDPYDCSFGIGYNAFFREILSMFTEVKGVGTAFKELQENPSIFDLSDLYNELDKMPLAQNIKDFIKSIFDMIKDIISNQKSLDIESGMNDFSKRILSSPKIYINLLNPLLSQKINEEELSRDMLELQKKIGTENISKINVDPTNIRLSDFAEIVKFNNISPEFIDAEKKIIDSVDSYNAKIFDFIDGKFGVASLTTNYNNPLMWSHYASAHRGICIEYDMKEYVQNLEKSRMFLFPVFYSKKRVTIDQNILDRIDLINITENGRNDILKLFFEGLITKNDIWKYENEWRSISLIEDSLEYRREIPFKNISAIYLGNKMDLRTIQAVLSIINEREEYGKINIYRMINDISEYRIERKEIKINFI